MTETSTEKPDPSKVVEDLASDEKVVALVKTGIDSIVSNKGKITLSDMLATVFGTGKEVEVSKAPPVPKPLTEKQTAALKRIPEVYGSVIVTADRKLTPKELAALVEERETITEVLSVLEKRKDESLREVFANHLDHVLPKEQQEGARLDSKGHFAVKQDVPVEGTGMKVQRSVSGGKPRLTIAQVEDLHAKGLIDRATYLKITKKPDVPRVLDEEGLHKAIQKDPRLFFLLGAVAETTTPTTTIKVVKDS